MSPKTKKILVKAFKSDNTAEVIEKELNKIEDEEERQKITDEMEPISTMGENKKLEKCVTNLKKKYEVKEDDKKTGKLIAEKMSDVSNCDVAAALFNQVADAQANDEEETPKKDENTEDSKEQE
jgi:uncharacterized membrane protein YheB (UPF0754 family)